MKGEMLMLYIILCFQIEQGISTGDILFLSPSGIVPIFVNSSVIFTCFHTSQTFQNFVWLINGTRVESSLITNHHIDNTSTDYSDLTIFSLPLQFNGTDIQCHVRFPNGNLLLSETSRLLLQGIVSAITELNLFYKNQMIVITWSPPFSFSVFGSTHIRYRVVVQNVTSLSTDTEDDHIITDNTMYALNYYSTHLLGCQNIMAIVTPVNPVGTGESKAVHLINGPPQIIYHELMLNLSGYYDLIIWLTSPLCSVNSLYLRNVNLNNDERVDEEFHQYFLYNTTEENYGYYFSLGLSRSLNYYLEILLENYNGTRMLNLNISTHTIRTIELESLSSGQLRINVTYSIHSGSVFGAFITLLYCRTDSCDIDYDNSLYLSIYGRNSSNYDINYKSGYYILYAYDIEADGSLFTSINNTTFSIPGRRVYFQFGIGSPTYNINSLYCSLRNNNETVSSRCNHSIFLEFSSAKQQLTLQPIASNQYALMWLLAGDPKFLNEAICLMIESRAYYGVTILLSNVRSEPIGRSIIDARNVAIHYTEEQLCDLQSNFTSSFTSDFTTQDQPTEASDTLIIIYPTVVSFLLLLLAILAILWFKNKCYECCKKKQKYESLLMPMTEINTEKESDKECFQTWWQLYEQEAKARFEASQLNKMVFEEQIKEFESQFSVELLNRSEKRKEDGITLEVYEHKYVNESQEDDKYIIQLNNTKKFKNKTLPTTEKSIAETFLLTLLPAGIEEGTVIVASTHTKHVPIPKETEMELGYSTQENSHVVVPNNNTVMLKLSAYSTTYYQDVTAKVEIPAGTKLQVQYKTSTHCLLCSRYRTGQIDVNSLFKKFIKFQEANGMICFQVKGTLIWKVRGSEVNKKIACCPRSNQPITTVQTVYESVYNQDSISKDDHKTIVETHLDSV